MLGQSGAESHKLWVPLALPAALRAARWGLPCTAQHVQLLQMTAVQQPRQVQVRIVDSAMQQDSTSVSDG